MEERDYEARYETAVIGTNLPGTNIEIIRTPAGRGDFRYALFDFDGTISLIREGWPAVMAGLMKEALTACSKRPSNGDADEEIRDFILQTMGKQTIYQMIGLAEMVAARGGAPLDPAEYKRRYSERLMAHIGSRREALRTGRAKPDDLLVKGARTFLEGLRERGVFLCLASGTDERYVREEAELLGVAALFEGRIYGALEDYKSFSKAIVIQRILDENRIAGKNLLGFGDGYVEIDAAKAAGGVGIGVATDETGKSDKSDTFKRERLLGVGADAIVPDYSDGATLLAYLMEPTHA